MGCHSEIRLTNTNRNTMKGLFAYMMILSVVLLYTESCSGLNLGRKLGEARDALEADDAQFDQPQSRFFFFAKLAAIARCRTTCAAVSYASTTSCTPVFSTLPCNVIFPFASG